MSEHLGKLDESERIELLLREFYTERNKFGGYIYSVIRDYSGMEDIMQEIAIVITKHADVFDFERPAGPWLMGIAKNETKRWLRQNRKHRMHVSFDLLDECIHAELIFDSEGVAMRENALENCIKNLPAKQAKIIRLRYVDGVGCESLSKLVNRSVQGVYSLLKRLKLALRDCVESQLPQETI